MVAAVREGEAELVALVERPRGFRHDGAQRRRPSAAGGGAAGVPAAPPHGAGADAEVWEPEVTGLVTGWYRTGWTSAGRPQLAARLRGRGGGRSLLLNGHIDAVSAEPVGRWTSPPHKPEVRDGLLYGRGSCDMKGGIAGMLFALETVTRLGAKLAGDVVFCTDTDEESSGAGAYACAAHGVRADAGLCAEPTGFDVWVACRGGVNPMVRTVGRTGHAEMHHPHWREGGPVNAIEKMEFVLASLRTLREDWSRRPEHQHPYLHTPDALPTVIRGGEWMVTYPSSCEVVLSVQYMPGRVDGDRGGQDVFDEVEAWVKAAADADDWLAEHPPEWEWPCDIVPAEVLDDHPIVTDTLAAGADVGRPGRISGLDSWHDAAVFTRVAGTPTVSFGPGDLTKAHTIDEAVPVADLVDHAAAVALMLLRWCGGTE